MVRLAILLLTIAVTAARGDRISLEKTLIADATLQAVTFVDAQHGWAVGDRGVILATDDGGQHWRQQSSGVRCPLSGVCFISRAKGWAVGGGWKPYLHTSYGVVLATDDGGLTWRRLPTPTLPLLRGVKFFDDQQGAAWGAASAFHPCGLFLTDDGGRGWRMLPSDRPASWNAADFTSLDNGLCAGAHGALATIAERGLRMRTAEAVLADLHAVRVDGKLNWAVGDGATIAVSTDRGASWRSALPLAEHDPATALNFQAIEARGGQAWVAGTPGSVIAHTTDGGANWNVAATRQTAPINDICFIDDSRGWAVGAGGVILSTVDGGATWNIIRNANQQPALCVVCPTMASVPLEYLTRCALADGYRTQVLLLEEGSPEELSCVSEAAVACGATSVERTTSADLAVRLATHQPLVIVAVESSLTSSPTSSQVTTGLDACSTLSRREQLTALGLSPPTPRRVVRITPDETGQWNAADFMATLGASPAQIAEPYEGWLKTSRTQNTHKYRFEVVRGDALPSLHRGDVLADCVLAFDSPRRRPLTAPADGQIENLRRLVQQRKHVEALLKRSLHGEAWANQVVTLTAGLSPEQGAPLLLELADSYRERGDFDQMAETWYLLARRYADHPLCESTIQSLLLYYASSEYAHFAESRRLPPGTDAARLADVSAESETTGAVLPVTAIEEGKASGVLSLAERRRRAQLLGEYLEQSRPTLFAEPRIRFALAACAPADPQASAANLANHVLPEEWRRAALAERWLAEPNRVANKPVATVRATTERPHLDGEIDDPCWTSATPLLLPSAGDETPPSVRFARDADYLYVALDVPQSLGAEYAPNAKPRERDEDLSAHDRIALRFDLDRDYSTAYELAIDSRGCTHDSLAGSARWNPKWFVASTLTKSRWRAEAAIPWRELCHEPPTPLQTGTAGGAWACDLARIHPALGKSRWTRAADDRSPEAFGLVRFE